MPMALQRTLVALLVPLLASLPAQGSPCGSLRGGEPLAITPLLVPAGEARAASPGDYRHQLQTTPLGWPLQNIWCVWVEPPPQANFSPGPARRWQAAIEGALEQWQRLLPVERVQDPDRAQVKVWRRRPPLARDGAGRIRASHGRALLTLLRQGEGPNGSLSPRVELLISPEQRQEAIQATALHELGHAFGIWGHSDDPGDAMAASPGAEPILELSARDRATVAWLYRQRTPFRQAP